MRQSRMFVGLDVQKNKIAVSIVDNRTGNLRFHGVVANTPYAVEKLIDSICPENEVVYFCYEGDVCDYSLYRLITSCGHLCSVVSSRPGPQRSGERVEPGRCVSDRLARLLSVGQLVPLSTPDYSGVQVRSELVNAQEKFRRLRYNAQQNFNGFFGRD